MTPGRRLMLHLASPGVAMVRRVVAAAVPDVVKVAALIEISGAAAVAARGLVKLRGLDPTAVDAYVSDRLDARAVLGRGRWLPTMVRPLPAPVYHPRAKRGGAA